ncbi:nuclear transition protein 2 [Tupaia chinensis]|uniref:nuclear transition protein 2 n=1 Tax=Tupaia chinensis TaxID=246437 RepID=UPI0003C8FB85|nr:nuclear transition protein 2 [Tupaia chinensis]
MDTKAQSLPIAHTQPHSNSRPQGHTCSQGSRSHHCQHCSWSCSRGMASHRSSLGHQGQSPGPSPSLPPRHHRQTMHSHPSPSRPTHHSSCLRKRKTLVGKVNKRKGTKRSRQVYKTKRRSSGRKCN